MMADSADDRERGVPRHDEAGQRRLAELGRRLDETKSRREEPRGPAGSGRAMAIAVRAVTELVVSVLVGGAIGWALDRWLNTSPVLLLIFFVLGFAAGIRNVVRATSRLQGDEDSPHEGQD